MFFGFRFFPSVFSGAARSERNASVRPSGDQRGVASCPGPDVRRAASREPSNGTSQIAER